MAEVRRRRNGADDCAARGASRYSAEIVRVSAGIPEVHEYTPPSDPTADARPSGQMSTLPTFWLNSGQTGIWPELATTRCHGTSHSIPPFPQTPFMPGHTNVTRWFGPNSTGFSIGRTMLRGLTFLTGRTSVALAYAAAKPCRGEVGMSCAPPEFPLATLWAGPRRDQFDL